MGRSLDDLGDLLALTTNDLPKQYFEVTWTNNDYEACRIYNKESMRIDGGAKIERKVMLSNTGNARYRTYYDTDEPTVGDVMHTIEVPWTRLSTSYSWDDFELLHQMNSTKGFIRLIKGRRIDGLWALADLIEERMWKTPTNSSSDNLYPYGIPYYLRLMNTLTSTDGFVGQTIGYQDGTTGTICANIDASTESNWRNYAFLYTKIDNSFLKKARMAFAKINYKAPLIVTDPAQTRNAQKRVYTDFDNWADFMDLADAKDDNHTGKDVLGNLQVDDGGTVYINRVPIVPLSQLESYIEPSTSTAVSPIFYVDFKYLVPVVHDGYWMEETKPMTDRGQHTTFTIYLDGGHQNLCTNVKALGWVGHLAH
jgi:hypothetical protein